jgi:capsular exopolysaccharide synthesis family protein
MSRFANLISRAIERESEEKLNERTAAALHNSDAPAARILQLPNRRKAVSKQISIVEPTDDAPATTATEEDWEWSEPPVFSQKMLGSGDESETADSIAKVRQDVLAATAVIETQIAAPAPSKLFVRPTFRTVEVNPQNVEPHLVAITDPRSTHCEELRNLRTRVLHAAQRDNLQAFTIASGSPSEGKSTVGLNLAWLLAQTDGVNALIIDADLRLPCLADYLDVNGDVGLSEVFSGAARLEDAIVRLEPSGLHLLPGGSPCENVAEMLSGNKFRAILEQTRKMFDYIIVDAPSLGTFTDAAVLMNITDSSIMVVRAGKTRSSYTHRLLETLPRERILGVVVNGSNEGFTNETHYDSYYYSNRQLKLAD